MTIATTKACPICRRPSEPKLTPFCSKRCADVDLGRWLTAQYVVPGKPQEADDEPTIDPAA